MGGHWILSGQVGSFLLENFCRSFFGAENNSNCSSLRELFEADKPLISLVCVAPFSFVNLLTRIFSPPLKFWPHPPQKCHRTQDSKWLGLCGKTQALNWTRNCRRDSVSICTQAVAGGRSDQSCHLQPSGNSTKSQSRVWCVDDQQYTVSEERASAIHVLETFFTFEFCRLEAFYWDSLTKLKFTRYCILHTELTQRRSKRSTGLESSMVDRRSGTSAGTSIRKRTSRLRSTICCMP